MYFNKGTQMLFPTSLVIKDKFYKTTRFLVFNIFINVLEETTTRIPFALSFADHAEGLAGKPGDVTIDLWHVMNISLCQVTIQQLWFGGLSNQLFCFVSISDANSYTSSMSLPTVATQSRMA
jgi:hypothetical protein